MKTIDHTVNDLILYKDYHIISSTIIKIINISIKENKTLNNKNIFYSMNNFVNPNDKTLYIKIDFILIINGNKIFKNFDKILNENELLYNFINKIIIGLTSYFLNEN